MAEWGVILSISTEEKLRMGNVQQRPSELINRERKRLVEGLKNDSGILLDGLMARGIITMSEYEFLDAMDDPERMVRRLLLIIQKKGYGYYGHRSHDSCCANDERKASSGGVHPGLPNTEDKDETGGAEGPKDSEAAELDTLEDQDSSKDPQTPENNESINEVLEEQEPQIPENDESINEVLEEQEPQIPENDESINEVLEEQEPQTPENDYFPECYEEPEVLEDDE
ncbi:nucleolar protein 3 isoform X3 [Dromiciops gliroides]|uniref:nucleolar protein 3 isoform X3 n=1 Tax=Dromiciops gliroides TaxID=33562 RepID=UPI001CC6A3F9|nr:nucleolar protein 3 isoform X3 [Dromiciops gliroides]